MPAASADAAADTDAADGRHDDYVPMAAATLVVDEVAAADNDEDVHTAYNAEDTSSSAVAS